MQHFISCRKNLFPVSFGKLIFDLRPEGPEHVESISEIPDTMEIKKLAAKLGDKEGSELYNLNRKLSFSILGRHGETPEEFDARLSPEIRTEVLRLRSLFAKAQDLVEKSN